jgi:hypothetical protein
MINLLFQIKLYNIPLLDSYSKWNTRRRIQFYVKRPPREATAKPTGAECSRYQLPYRR